MPLLPNQRHLFSIPDEIAYFNCAYYSPQLRESERRLIAGARSKSSPWERTPAHFFEDAETVRGLASELFGGDADGYAVIPAASYGIGTAARILEPRLNRGDEILVMAEEFPSNVLAWRTVCQARGASISTVPTPEDFNWTPALLNRLHSRIKVVAVSACHWTNGATLDLVTLGKAARAAGAALIIDGTQSLGAMPFRIESVRPDFLVAAAYKWLLSPYGTGFMYVAEHWRGERPLEESWQTRDNAENFAGLVNYSDTYMGGARKFDMGEKGAPTTLPGFIAALEQIRDWGIANIAATLTAINTRIAHDLEGLGFVPTPAEVRAPHILGAQIPPHFPNSVVTALRDQNIYISQRGSALRFAPHLYVNDGDIDRLCNALSRLKP